MMAMWIRVQVSRPGKQHVCAWAPAASLCDLNGSALDLSPEGFDGVPEADASSGLPTDELLKMAVSLLSPESDVGDEHGLSVLWLWAQHAYNDNGWNVKEDPWIDRDVNVLRKKALLIGWPKSEVQKVRGECSLPTVSIKVANLQTQSSALCR
eukprot:SAG31_NODE_18323_length_640_cov_1.048059_1_plen_153_part_00